MRIPVSVTSLCDAPVTMTRLMWGFCAKCSIGDATVEDCFGPFSILSDVTRANSGVPTLEPAVTVKLTLEPPKIQLSWDQSVGETASCEAYNTFEYGALATLGGVSKTLVDYEKIFVVNPDLGINVVDSGM